MSTALKLAALILLLVGVSVGVWTQLRGSKASRGIPEMSYSRFLREVDGDQVERVTVKGLSVTGYGKDARAFHVQLPYLDPQLADDISTHSEATFEEDDTTPWDKILLWALPALVLGVSLGLWTNANFSPRPRNPSQLS